MQLFRLQLSHTLFVNVMLIDIGIEPTQQILDTAFPIICYDKYANTCRVRNLTPPAKIGNDYDEMRKYVHGVLGFCLKLFPQTKTIDVV